MKRVIVIFILFLFTQYPVFALQNIFDKYKSKEDIQLTTVSPLMLHILGGWNIGGPALQPFIGNMDSMTILSTDNFRYLQALKEDFDIYAEAHLQHLASVSEGGAVSEIYLQPDGRNVNAMVLWMTTDQEITVMEIIGTFSLDDFEALIRSVD